MSDTEVNPIVFEAAAVVTEEDRLTSCSSVRSAMNRDG